MYYEQTTGEKTTNIPGGRREMRGIERYPLRAVLITDSGMYTLLLPESMTGHFRFQNENGLDADLPLYFEPAGSNWSAYCEGTETYLQQWGSESRMRQIPLSDKMVAKIRVGSEELLLYVEEEKPGDRVFLPYYLEERADYTIGRSHNQLIQYSNDTVSREHAILHWEKDSWYIQDNDSTNGVFVNGKRVQYQKLTNGDSIFIMGLTILMGSGFVAINNANGRISINTPRIRRIRGQGDVYYPPCLPVFPDKNLFDRQPRKLISIPAKTIDIDMPPMQMSANKIPLLLRMGSPMVMGGRAIATGNILMALTSLVFPAMTQGLTEKDRKEYESKRTARYKEYLYEKSEEIALERQTEEKLLNKNYPPLSGAMQFATTRQRLWERRRSDEDFLSIRLGSGEVPMIAEKNYSERKFEMEPDPLAEEMYKLAEREELLKNAPVMLQMREDRFVGVYGDTAVVVQLFRGMVLQIALTHSYDEVKVIVLGEPEQLRSLDFVRYLPHNWDDDRSIRFFAASQSDAQQIGSYLSKELEEIVTNESPEKLLKNKPAYVIFALSKQLFDAMEILKSVLRHEKYCGVSILAAFQGAPKECSKIVDLRNEHKIVDLMHPEAQDQLFREDMSDPGVTHDGIRQLMRLRLKLSSQLYQIPATVTFLEMFGVGMVEHLNPLKRWRDNNPVKSLSCPVGVGTDGKLFTLDLHEKRQGPHGLVAGMTGSGKSEFLITYILSMAVNYSPDEVAFILIDYKGGGLADAFEDKSRGIHLPHLVGTITNLDGAAIQRSLMSINSEMKRRQAVFKRAKSETGEGTMDIYDYQKLYRAHRVSEPLPHLFIISDEFAELKAQQPEFMDELISTARIGRSLGVHLILATQKPSGVVNDQIWSNTRFRVCLKVQDRGDSIEMLKRPEAAELRQTGRFYLQVGYNEYFALGQSAWCGAAYEPQEEICPQKDEEVQIIDSVGHSLVNARPAVQRNRSEVKQLVSIVRYLSSLAQKEKIEPRSLWKEPLPSLIGLEDIGSAVVERGQGVSALIGMIDDPMRQEQYPLVMNLEKSRNLMLIGESASGKTTLFQTMLYDLSTHYSPQDVNYYILDYSSRNLGVFQSLPHCGAFLTDDNESSLEGLLDLIRGIIDERRQKFAEVGVGSFSAYCEIERIPLILFIIDNITRIDEFKGHSDYYSVIGEIMKSGAVYGVKTLYSATQINDLMSFIRRGAGDRLTLRCQNRYAYSDILDCRCTYEPNDFEGRGMCVVEDRCLEYQTALAINMPNEHERNKAIKQRINEISVQYADFAPAKRIETIDEEQEYSAFCGMFSPERIPIGYELSSRKKVSIPLQQLYSLSLYFGSDRPPLIQFANLLQAASRENGDIVFFRRADHSILDSIDLEVRGRLTVLDYKEDSVSALTNIISSAIIKNKGYRDEFCRNNGITNWRDPEAIKQWRKYVRLHSRPVFIFIESLVDLIALTDVNSGGMLTSFFGNTVGYNIYFFAGFYHDDSERQEHFIYRDGKKEEYSEEEKGRIDRMVYIADQIKTAFNSDQTVLLFGGRFNKQMLVSLPYEYRSIETPCRQENDNKVLLVYRGAEHNLVMPCGVLEDQSDEDERPII